MRKEKDDEKEFEGIFLKDLFRTRETKTFGFSKEGKTLKVMISLLTVRDSSSTESPMLPQMPVLGRRVNKVVLAGYSNYKI